MGSPLRHVPVKLIAGLISQIKPELDLAVKTLKNKFGATDQETELLDFACTRYYEEEMGYGLKRKFLSFGRLQNPEAVYLIKLYTNKVERKLSRNNKRIVNIDSGYISPASLVLFTTKNHSHRIYQGKGIYADLELCFEKNSFQPLRWTYPDYKFRAYIDFFNSVRKKYLSQLKEHKGTKGR